MATTYGVTSLGFVAKNQAIILAEIESDQLADIDPALDVSADQPLGQINGIVSRNYAELWELGQAAYNAFDRDKAEGDSLESLGKLTGTAKRAAASSGCLCTVVLSAGATLLAGVHFIQDNLNPSVQFTPSVNYTQAAAGTYTNVLFVAQNAGPLVVPSGRLTVIGTPVSGWVSVTNTTAADGGRVADNDVILRKNMDTDVAATGTSTVDALRADVLALGQSTVPQMQSVTVFENVGDAVDANGLPPHSFNVLVYDGDTPSGTNADFIAKAIWKGKPAGIRSFGSLTGNTTDDLGNLQVVQFDRVTRVLIYLTYRLTTDATYAGNAAFAAFIANFANNAYAVSVVGTDVFWARAIATAFFFPGVVTVVSLTLGITASPTGTADIAIGPRELARFDATRIVNL